VDIKPNQGTGRKEPNMLIQGCDYHPSMQPIAFVDTETGERGERRRTYRDGEAERFYRELKQRQIEVRVGREATG
jgi:transposase